MLYLLLLQNSPTPTTSSARRLWLVEVGGGGNFLKVGFFSRWVFGIFLKKVFLQGGFLAFFKKRFFCKVFFFKKLNDVLKGGGFFSMGGWGAPGPCC